MKSFCAKKTKAKPIYYLLLTLGLSLPGDELPDKPYLSWGLGQECPLSLSWAFLTAGL